jgi:hypothetical protein
MNQRTFLYQLQLIDHDLDKNEKRLSELRDLMSFNSDEKLIEQEISALLIEKKSQNQKLNKISDEANIIQEKITKSEQSLYDGSIKNPKELQSVNIEIDSLKKRRTVLDEQQLEFLFLIDNLDEQLKIKEESLSTLLVRKNDQKEIFQIEIDEIEKVIKKLNIDKNPVLNQIENSYLETYEKLRKTKNKIAISIIIDNACSICGNGLPPMEVQKAKSSIDEIFCPVCKRFLYCG